MTGEFYSKTYKTEGSTRKHLLKRAADDNDAQTLHRLADTENNPKSGPTLKDSDANTELNLGLADF